MEDLAYPLPIGSIVKYKDWEQLLMIYGRHQKKGDTGVIWDYVACYYPIGNISDQYNLFFNQEGISEVVFRGYENAQEKELQAVLVEQKE
ncbi:DUF4176 domain-containing protein [Priestia koreensis]|uniref:DUF4176 domain-containing protein n=1 Tax=Priestia koreensis TaxID=284581 RepID=UPI0034582739